MEELEELFIQTLPILRKTRTSTL